jgi:L,D-peptidoglycan transpeptidase YkuD (ErfK/YbiS/YcfS/YnhG family)
MLSAALCAGAISVTTAAPARASEPSSARFRAPADAQQLVVVSSPSYEPPDYLATLRTYERDGPIDAWREVLSPSQAETGYGHLRDQRHEGDGSTPTGVFGFGARMFGNMPNPGGLHYRYHRLRCGDWWDEDPFSPDYNRFVHVACGVTPPFASDSEALWTETTAYPYFAVVQFNVNPTVGGLDAPGSGIFLHAWVHGTTAGCVALPAPHLLQLLRWLAPASHPVIAIGTDRELASLRLPAVSAAARRP